MCIVVAENTVHRNIIGRAIITIARYFERSAQAAYAKQTLITYTY